MTPGSLRFSPSQTMYAVTVPAGTSNLSVTATLSDPARATLELNGRLATSGQALVVPLTVDVTSVVLRVNADSGASKSYVLTVLSLSPRAPYFKASNTGVGDHFGEVLALSADGNTLAVAGPYEDSGSTGVGGNQADDSALTSGAVYVFARTGITWAQQAYLKASNTDAEDFFGFGLALSANGDTLVVGAGGDDSDATGIDGNQTDNSAINSGAVYVFTRSGGTWSQQAFIKASNAEMYDVFGEALALSADGNTLAVGANGEDSNATGVGGNRANNASGGSGAAYVFTRAGTVWSERAYLKASNTGEADFFGGSLAISADGSVLAVGAQHEDSSASGVGGNQADNSMGGTGAVYLFAQSGGTWAQQAYLKASNPGANDYFGYTLALSGDGNTLAVAAPDESSNARGIGGNQADNSAPQSGAAYVFARTGNNWAQQAYVKASNAEAEDGFGYSLALSFDGNTLVVGATAEDSNATGIDGDQSDNSAFSSGAVYAFKRTGTAWAQQSFVKALNTGGGDNFGYAVALSADGTVLAVGAWGEDSNAIGVWGDQANNSMAESGAAYVFTR